MLSSDETKGGGRQKPRKVKPNGDKAGQRKRKAAKVPEMDQPRTAPESIGETVGETEIAAPVTVAETAAPPAFPPDASSSADTSPAAPAAAEESAPVSYRSLADAWGDYSRMSLEQTRSYFEKLAGARSLGAAFELQAEFAKQACETFVAQSQKISELQGEMAKQRLKRLEGFMEKMTLGVPRERQS